MILNHKAAMEMLADQAEEIRAAQMKPTESKTVQARILKYAVAIGWTLVSRDKK